MEAPIEPLVEVYPEPWTDDVSAVLDEEPAIVDPVPPPAPSTLPATEEPRPSPAALSSSTLAELYFTQGFTDKAIEVYRELLVREPDNARASGRVTELMGLQAQLARDSAGMDGNDPRRARIERTIARLEDFLVAVKRG
jgi:hypothetical protein